MANKWPMYHIKAMAVTKQMDHNWPKTGAEYQPETALEHVSHHLVDSEQLCKVVLKEAKSTVCPSYGPTLFKKCKKVSVIMTARFSHSNRDSHCHCQSKGQNQSKGQKQSKGQSHIKGQSHSKGQIES
jgi:hypothetical protein